MAKRRAAAAPPCAPGVPIGVAARTVIARLLGGLGPAMAAARAGGVEGIHQLRVVTRRLRSALALLEPALPSQRAERLQDELAWLGRAAGTVRDLDVMAEAIGKRRRKIDAAFRPALTTILRHVRESRRSAHAAFVTALDSPRAARLSARLVALAGSPTGAGGRGPCWTRAPDLTRPLVRAVHRAGDGVDESSPESDLHRLRVRAKRLRYALEVFEGLAGDRTAMLTKRLTKLQRLAGDHHDAVTQSAWLRGEMTAFAGDAEALVVLGAIVEGLRRRARRTARDVPGQWKRTMRPKLVRDALDELGRKPHSDERKASG
jgi:CHAD domain-containing protein